jgi:hypothetical protein
MEVAVWILGIAVIATALAYATIGVCVLAAKYRMAHVPAQHARATLAAGSIVDWRYPTH